MGLFMFFTPKEKQEKFIAPHNRGWRYSGRNPEEKANALKQEKRRIEQSIKTLRAEIRRSAGLLYGWMPLKRIYKFDRSLYPSQPTNWYIKGNLRRCLLPDFFCYKNGKQPIIEPPKNRSENIYINLLRPEFTKMYSAILDEAMYRTKLYSVLLSNMKWLEFLKKRELKWKE